MTSADLLPASVLKRKAVVYVRQSTQAQVQTNLESQRRQYELVDVARRRGFSDVEAIDDDLGRSASGMAARPGFDRLVAWLCAGQVGAVLCFDASRLARNGRDWRHLLELCGLVEARVIDLDGVYDPCRPNDRLLLGMKGSISQFELGVLRARGRGPGQPVYRCERPNQMLGLPRRFAFGGLRVDAAIARELLRAVEPMAIEAALEAERRHMESQAEQRRILELELQQARYDASLAERRYAACDPDKASRPCRRHHRRRRRGGARGHLDDPLARRSAFAIAGAQAEVRRARPPHA